MYAYQVGYSGYEGGHDVVLIHEKLFSQDEFEEMVIEAYCEAARAAVAHNDKQHAEWAEQDRKQAEEALQNQDYLTYARCIAESEIHNPARLYSDSLLDRYQPDIPLEESEDHPHVVDFLVSKFGFVRLQYQGRAFVFDMINLISSERSDTFTSFEQKLVDRMRLSLNVHEDIPNHSYDRYRRKDQHIDEILASIGAPSRAELESKDQGETTAGDTEDSLSFSAVEQELLRAFGLGEEEDDTDSSSNS